MFSRAASPLFYDRLFAEFDRQHFRPRVGQETDSLPITVALVAAGEGISCFGRQVGEHFPHAVKVRPIVDIDFNMGPEFAWIETNDSPVRTAFLDLFK